MISYGDMLDTIEKNEPHNHHFAAEKKGGVEPEKKYFEPENEVEDPEDVI